MGSALTDGRDPTRRAPPKKKKPLDPKIKKRAEELTAMGMPFQMAMAVAHGRLDLSLALERMAQKDRVGKLMRDYDLSRALATQVAMGHADLELVLMRRRLQEHREENRDRTCLQEGAELTLALTGGTALTGQILEVVPYTFRIQERKGAPEELHKLRVKFAYEPSAWKVVKKAIKVDKRLADAAREPAVRPQDRYSCSDKRLFTYLDSEREVVVTTVEGDVLRGVVAWFSRYEFGLRLKGDVEVTVFRHALQDISSP